MRHFTGMNRLCVFCSLCLTTHAFFPQGLIGWNDPAHSYDHHNLIFDVPWKGMPRTKVIAGNTRDTNAIVDQSGYHESSEHGPQNEAVAPEEVAKPHLFSTVKHYPPEWTKQFSS